MINKPLGIRQQRRLEQLLTKVYEDATFNNAAFDSIIGTPPDDPLPRSEKEVTAFIKRRTDLYRRSWLLSPLQEALAILNDDQRSNQ